MKKELFLVCIIIFSVFCSNAQTFITPNTSPQDTSLQVFISGTQSDFTSYSWCGSPYVYLSDQEWGNTIIEVPNNASDDWQIHPTLGNGFYSTISIPFNAYLGNYNLYVYDANCGYGGSAMVGANVFMITFSGFECVLQDFSIENQSQGTSSWSSIMLAGSGDELSVNLSGIDFNLTQYTSVYTDIRFIYSDLSVSNYSMVKSNFHINTQDIDYNSGHIYFDGHTHQNFLIPNGAPEGFYDLELLVNNQWVGFSSSALDIVGPSITDINPHEGNEGQSLSVTISGIAMDYGSQWSGTLSDFRFSQSSGTANPFTGTSTSEDGIELYGDINIPSGQDAGWYDLEVWDNGSNQYIILEDAFEVIQLSDMIFPNTSPQDTSLQVFISVAILWIV